MNVDVFPGGDLTLDLRRNLPFESNCCEQIFSEHCIEHFDYPDAVSHLLQECLRILKPSGVFRFSVPDTEWPLLSYAEGPAAEYFQACKVNPSCIPATARLVLNTSIITSVNVMNTISLMMRRR